MSKESVGSSFSFSSTAYRTVLGPVVFVLLIGGMVLLAIPVAVMAVVKGNSN